MFRWLFLFLLVTSVAFGDPIRNGNNTALVVIDMQEPFVTRGGNADRPENARKVKEVIERQKDLIRLARKQNIPIIFIEYDEFGDTNSALRKATEGYAQTRVIHKNTDGMLDSENSHLSELSAFLQVKEIGNLIITGANGGACVQMSIQGALRNNFNVIAYSKGIADFNYEEFVYPYDDQYTGFDKPECLNCTFREVDDLPTLSLLLESSGKRSSDAGVNNSDRSVPRLELPSRIHKFFSQPTSTTKQ